MTPKVLISAILIAFSLVAVETPNPPRVDAAACTSVDVTTDPTSPQPQGEVVTFTASASGCVSAEHQFWMLPPGGSWQIMQSWSADDTWDWDTQGQTTGSWLSSIWAREEGSGGSYQAYAETPFQLVVGERASALT